MLDHGADTSLLTEKGEIAASLASTADIRQLLGEGDMNGSVNEQSLPIMPNYIKMPVIHSKEFTHTSNGTLPRRTTQPQENSDGMIFGNYNIDFRLFYYGIVKVSCIRNLIM